MKHRFGAFLACAASILSMTAANAQGLSLPGDHGAAPPPPGPFNPNAPVPAAPPIELALKAAQTIAAACKQYRLAVAVTDSEGVATLIYVPDRSAAFHGYNAVRKAYTAITFKADTSQVIKQLQDPAVAEKFKSDLNLKRQRGGLLLMAGDKIVGAIGVSGAEPGGHDEECGLAGRDAIKGDLK